MTSGNSYATMNAVEARLLVATETRIQVVTMARRDRPHPKKVSLWGEDLLRP